MSSDQVNSCPLIKTNVALDNVGQVQWDDAHAACLPDESVFGSQAGDLVIGGMGTRGGVERFDVTVERGQLALQYVLHQQYPALGDREKRRYGQ